jgi:hypothetical protein
MSRRSLTEAQVIALLQSVGPTLEFPPTPPLATAVRARLEAPAPATEPATQPRVAWWRLRPLLAGAAVILVALGLSLTFSVSARRAVADLLGVVGINISFDETDTDGLPEPPLNELGLGIEVTRSEAEEIVGFDLRGPDASDGSLSIYLDDSIGDSGMVSTVIRQQGQELPKILITEFKASVETGFIKKLADGKTEVHFVTVAGFGGYWLTGEPHFFAYADEAGKIREESIRLAGNVLLWEAGGITYRIEGAGSLAGALRLAAEMGF